MTRDLLTSIVSNVVTKEVNAIRRGLKQNPTVDEFRVWATGFFNDHVEHVRNVIASPVKAPADYAQRYCSETCSQVCQARDDEQLEALLDSWANDRPAAIVDELMNDKAVAE